MMGIWLMPRYFCRASREAVVPARRAETTMAPGFCAKLARPAKKARSRADKICPAGWAKYTGEPKMDPSAVWARSMSSLTTSSKTQCPLVAQWPQAIHPAMGLFPSRSSSVWIPSCVNAFATSSKARRVHPSGWGLPFTNNTFICNSSFIGFWGQSFLTLG